MTFEIFVIFLLVFIGSSLIKGWSGFGTNLIAMPILASFLGYSLDVSVTIVISVNVFMNIAILVENKKFNLKSLESIKVLVFFGVIFTFIGAWLLKSPSNQQSLKIIAGSAIVLIALYRIYVNFFEINRYIDKDNMHKYFIPVGIISGFFNGIAGLGGLPVLLLLSNTNMKRDKFRTTLVSYFLVMNIVAIIGYLIAGNYTVFVTTSIGLMIIPAVAACMFGVWLSRRVSDKIFSRVMLGVLLILGINLIINGVLKTNIFALIFK